jgi:hypothetical protein
MLLVILFLTVIIMQGMNSRSLLRTATVYCPAGAGGRVFLFDDGASVLRVNKRYAEDQKQQRPNQDDKHQWTPEQIDYFVRKGMRDLRREIGSFLRRVMKLSRTAKLHVLLLLKYA